MDRPLPDRKIVADIIRHIATTVVMPRFRTLAEEDIQNKDDGTLVTIVDHQCEHLLAEALTLLDPDSRIVGEEGATQDPKILRYLTGMDPVWVIDPLDGTRNFTNGSPKIAMMVAYVLDEETLMGWIYDPVRNIMISAEKGQGAWINDSKMERFPAAPARLSDMEGFIDFDLQKKFRDSGELDAFKSCKPLMSMGQEYLTMVTGQRHFAVFTRIKPWDHAAGVLIMQEAGGYAAIKNGQDYIPGSPLVPLIAACDAQIARTLYQTFCADS